MPLSPPESGKPNAMLTICARIRRHGHQPCQRQTAERLSDPLSSTRVLQTGGWRSFSRYCFASTNQLQPVPRDCQADKCRAREKGVCDSFRLKFTWVLDKQRSRSLCVPQDEEVQKWWWQSRRGRKEGELLPLLPPPCLPPGATAPLAPPTSRPCCKTSFFGLFFAAFLVAPPPPSLLHGTVHQQAFTVTFAIHSTL